MAELGPNEAVGTGIYTENNCQPDCVIGKFVKTPVAISLTNLVEYKSKFYLKNLVIISIKGKDVLPEINSYAGI